jgi:putative methionine-R-sulfoxide reductase with GAF domain
LGWYSRDRETYSGYFEYTVRKEYEYETPQNVAVYDGPYYECSNKVQSELCVPILNSKLEVIGIIDAESWKPNWFTEERVLEICKVASDIGDLIPQDF